MSAEGIRIYAHASAHNDPGFRCVVPSRLVALEGAAKYLEPSPSPYAAPRWLEPGADLALGGKRSRGVLTWQRPVLVNRLSAKNIGAVEASLPDVPCSIRLPHPQGKPIAKVRIDGQEWTSFDIDRVDLPNGALAKKIEVEYQR